MVQPVVDYLVGRGHRVIRATDIGLGGEEDWVLIEYADGAQPPYVLVTFDTDFKNAAVRRDARCLWIRDPERTARARVAEHYDALIQLFERGQRLVTLPRLGGPE
jgi:hypothetical protein